MEARLTRIDEAEVLRYLRVRAAPDAALRRTLDAMCALLLETAKPRLVWRRLERSENEALVVGKDLQRLLRHSHELVIFAATLGMEAERLMQQMQVRDLAQALILDACADSAIENVCDNFCADLRAAVQPLSLTRRFSPGYGDLPLTYQNTLFDRLDITRRIGVTLTPGGLMLPQKSVTAILGLQDINEGGCQQ